MNAASDQRLRVGVIGCANIAWRSMLPAMLACDQIQLVAVASRTVEKALKFGDRFGCDPIAGYEQLLTRDDIDAVYIPLPTGLHELWVMNALMTGKHVLVEKSFAPTYEAAQRMVALAQAQNLLILENFLFPHHSQHSWVMARLTQGELGPVHLLRSTFGFPPLSPENIRYQPELGGGALLDVGTYGVKLATLLLGDDLTLLGATLEFDPQQRVDIYGDVMLRNPQGQVAQISFGFNYYYQCHYELLGTQGKLIVERAFTPPPGVKPIVRIEQQGYTQVFTLAADNYYVNMLQFWATEIASGTDFSDHWATLLHQARLLDMIRQAAR